MASTSTAQAQDNLNFVGTAELQDVVGNPSQLFINFLGASGGSIMATETINGAFAPTIIPGMMGTIADITADAGGVLNLPVDPFVQIGGFSFTLAGAPNGTTFGPISLFGDASGTIGRFGVTGTVTGGAYGATGTSYTGLFTTQFAGLSPEQVFNQVNSGGTLPVSFSANFVVNQSVVPEPSTYLLMATGLGALALVGLRRRSTQS